MRPTAACDRCPRRRLLVCSGAAHRLAVAILRPLTYASLVLEQKLDRHDDVAIKLDENRNPEANRGKGELRASSPFPLGGYSALPRTGGIPRPLEAHPHGQTMPTKVRAWHLDLAVRRQQALTCRVSLLAGLQLLPSDLFEIVLRKAALIAEEPMIGRAIHVPVVSQRRQLNTANIIRNPRHEIVFRHGISIDSGVARQTRMNRAMHGAFYCLLPVVVVDFDAIITKKEFNLFPNERYELPLDTFCQRIFARELSLSISQNHVTKRRLLDEDLKAHEITLPHTQINLIVLFMTANHRREVKCSLNQPGIGKCLTISTDTRGDVDRLVVKNKSDQIVVGAGSNITGLINEDRKLPHVAIPRLIKMPGDTPRRRDSPPCVERCSIYTTRRFVYSIIPKYEHMFSTLRTNMCSTYGKAA